MTHFVGTKQNRGNENTTFSSKWSLKWTSCRQFEMILIFSVHERTFFLGSVESEHKVSGNKRFSCLILSLLSSMLDVHITNPKALDLSSSKNDFPVGKHRNLVIVLKALFKKKIPSLLIMCQWLFCVGNCFIRERWVQGVCFDPKKKGAGLRCLIYLRH